MTFSRRVAFLGAVALSVSIVSPVAAQTSHLPLGADAQQVLRVVMDSIGVTNALAIKTIVGLPVSCRPTEGGCVGKVFAADRAAEATKSAEYAASLIGSHVAKDAVAAARDFVAPARIDSAKPRSSWYRVCGPADGPPTNSRVVIVRPSVVRESKPGVEWRVIVTVNSYPTRGECVGYASAYDYVVARDARTGMMHIVGMQFIGGGTGRLQGR